MSVHIAVTNHSTVLDDTDAEAIMAAVSHQVRYHFAPVWNENAIFGWLGRTSIVPRGSWELRFLDNSDQAGALGYHEDPLSVPLMKVFVKTCQVAGISESSCASHEVLEALVDPLLNDARSDLGSRFYAAEVGDPVQAEGYSIGGVEVSNFVYPSWFDTTNRTGKFDRLGALTGPFKVAPGGYTQYVDMKEPAKGWQDVGAELYAGHERPGRRRSNLLEPEGVA